MSADVLPLIAYGDRVWVQTVTAADLAPYRRAVEMSVSRIRRWNPVNPDDLMWHLGQQSVDHRTFIVHAHHRLADHDIVGKVNVMNVVRGRMQSGTMGYDSYDPYAGAGLFAEGLRLVIGLAFKPFHEGMGLHRVEADVRPGNEPSAGLLRSLGFRREGHVPRLLWLAAEGIDQWCDHDTYAVTSEDWPAVAYREHAPFRVAAVVDGQTGPARTALARRLAAELGVPLFSGPSLGVDDPALLCRMLADSPSGGVLETDPGEGLDRGLELAGWDPRAVPEVRWGAATRGHAGRPSMHVDSGETPSARTIAALALRVRALHA